MVKDPKYTKLELRILSMVKKHLESELRKRNIIVSSGIHIKPKPKKARVDVLELNLIGCQGSRISKNTTAFVNVNYQHEDFEQVEEFTIFINDLLTDAVVGKFHFNLGSQDWDYQIFRSSPYLWLGNNFFLLRHI